MNTPTPKLKQFFPYKHRRILISLVLVVLLMFGFGYALVPIYNVFCKLTGLNGKTGGEAALSNTIDKSRTVTIEFVASTNAYLPWQFYPLVQKVKVFVGENKRVAFFAENDSDNTMVVQAIPSVTPGLAAKYLKKTECFCFTRQTLKGRQALDMPLIFHIDPALPKDIKLITLSYTLFDVAGLAPLAPKKKL